MITTRRRRWAWIGRPNDIELVPLLPCHPGGLLGCREREVLVIVLETLLLPVNYAPNTTYIYLPKRALEDVLRKRPPRLSDLLGAC